VISVTLNQSKLKELQAHLGIRENIKIEVIDSDTPGIKANLLGDAHALLGIRLVVGRPKQGADRLLFAHNEIVRTLLHEFKHVQQFQNWSSEEWERDGLQTYGSCRSEHEANEFANANYQKWRSIITLKRPMKSRLSKLSVAEQNVRKSR
jgi:hypothetical protein